MFDSLLTRLPEPIKRKMAEARVSFDQYRSANEVTVHWESYEFVFGYWDRVSFSRARKAIRNDEIGHEGIPLRTLQVPASCDGIIDIGAHIGSYTIPLAVINDSLETLAFEPDSYNHQVLSMNIARNRLSDDRVRAERAAVSNVDGTSTFFKDSGTVGAVAGTLKPVENDAQYEPVEVPVRDIKTVCTERCFSHPWVKIDAEGEELHILERLLNGVPNVTGIVELHLNRDDVSREKFHNLFFEHDLSVSEIKSRYTDTNPAFLFSTTERDYVQA